MKNYPGHQVLETQFNDDDANKAAAQLQAVFARNPDLAGVFGANLFSALGAANGVKQAGQSGKIKVVAFDAPTSRSSTTSRPAWSTSRSPSIRPRSAISASCPPMPHLTGQSVPTAIGTGFTVMTKDNIDDPNVAKFVYSELS